MPSMTRPSLFPGSLRGRLLSAMLALVAIGLLCAGVATYQLISSSLVGQLDQQLRTAYGPVSNLLDQLGSGGQYGPNIVPLPPGAYAEFVDAHGNTLPGRAVAFAYTGQHVPPPALPAGLPGSATGPGTGYRLFTTPAAGDGRIMYRAIAVPLPGRGGSLIVAIPYSSVTQTLHRLLKVEVGVGLAVLGLTAALALWLVRLGLDPLRKMGETAEAIASGDLSRRVTPADEETEVGRLGLSLNRMLEKIEESFARQKASEERLRRFVADASHELRTPLTSIRGYAELFRRGASARPEDLTKSMRRIEQEASRMAVLVDDLLLLARLDQGRPLERAPVDLVRVVSDAVADARVVDPSRQVTFGAPPALVVPGDDVRLRQVAGNLLTNAIGHTPAGTPVEVRVIAEGELALFEVTDHGEGIPADQQAHVFEPFYRADPSRARDSGGAGLGLSIVAAIVQAHGGTVEVGSPPGEGATFRVRLPREVLAGRHDGPAGANGSGSLGSPAASEIPG